MAKDSFWFKHDYGAINDDKISEIIARHGIAAYGIYWAVVEAMVNNENGGVMATLLGGLSSKCKTTKDEVLKVLKSCVEVELFFEEKNTFYSPRILKHKSDRNMLSVEGKKGSDLRWGNRGAIANPIAPQLRAEQEESRREQIRIAAAMSKKERKTLFEKTFLAYEPTLTQKELDVQFEIFHKKYEGKAINNLSSLTKIWLDKYLPDRAAVVDRKITGVEFDKIFKKVKLTDGTWQDLGLGQGRSAGMGAIMPKDIFKGQKY